MILLVYIMFSEQKSLVKVGRGVQVNLWGFFSHLLEITHLSLPGPAWPFPVCIVLHAQQDWLYHMMAVRRVQQNSSQQRNFSQQRMEQVTWHSTAEEQLPSQLIKACPQQAPLSPTLLPIPPCCPPYSTPPDCYLDTQSVSQSMRQKLSIKIQTALDSPKHANKPACWRVWHTLTWPHGPGFMCSLTNCSSKVSIHL